MRILLYPRIVSRVGYFNAPGTCYRIGMWSAALVKDNQGSRYPICKDAYGTFSVIDDLIGLPGEVGVTSVLLQKSEHRTFSPGFNAIVV